MGKYQEKKEGQHRPWIPRISKKEIVFPLFLPVKKGESKSVRALIARDLLAFILARSRADASGVRKQYLNGLRGCSQLSQATRPHRWRILHMNRSVQANREPLKRFRSSTIPRSSRTRR